MDDQAPDPELSFAYASSISMTLVWIAVGCAWTLAEDVAPIVRRTVPAWEYPVIVGILVATCLLAIILIPKVHAAVSERMVKSRDRALKAVRISSRGFMVSTAGLAIGPVHAQVTDLAWWTGATWIGISLLALALAMAIRALSIMTNEPPRPRRRRFLKPALGLD